MQKSKEKLHPRNKHLGRYDFKQLVVSHPELEQFVITNKYQDESIDFFNPKAVLSLNTALLRHFYKIDYWSIPSDYLCPPIPGRADYIHHIADLLASKNNDKLPPGKQINCLDIGVGANCIYPIIGNKEYAWSFTGTDIDPIALENANKIIESNPSFKGRIKLRLQENPKNIFEGIIKEDEHFDITICNPPFHSSLEDAQSGTLRKLSNLKSEKITKTLLNFGGQSNELWTEGGEKSFLNKMILESKQYANSCYWFSSLISKRSNLKGIYSTLKKVKAVEVKTILLATGNKTSRIVAWTFLTIEEQKSWIKERWNK